MFNKNKIINKIMLKKLLILSTIVLISLTSCNSNKKKLLVQIKKIEKETFADSSNALNFDKANLLIKSYTSFIDKYPKESKSAEFLFKAIEIAMNTGQGDLAIQFIDKFQKQYSDNAKLPTAIFLKGYIYENILKNTSKARIAYVEFITRFPKHQLVNDAKACIKNLGKTDDEIIKEFEEKLNNQQALK
jgi:outer membrane protein assembly factor BamD (BamD/ComL family)